MFAVPAELLDDDERVELQLNLTQLRQKRKRAELRDAYYDGRKRLDQYGISIPPQMRDLEAVVGWPAKTCDALSARLHLGGFVQPGSAEVNSDLRNLFSLNQMSVEWPQAQVSTFINGVSFGAVTPGDESAGEPPVLIQMMSATEATGIWDGRRRGLRSAIWTPPTQPKLTDRFVLFMQDRTVTGTRDPGQKWQIERVDNPLPRVAVTPLRYRPRMGRPFGMSRISRPVMSMTDQAVRTILRSEVSAEFFSSPQRYALGADESAFQDASGQTKTAWEAILGKVWAIGRDEDGNIPSVGQFPQASPQPHVDLLRMVATMFSGETSLPVSSLGIIHDNPASAEAIDAAWADMVGVAEQCQVELGSSAVEIAQNVLMLSDGLSELPKNLIGLRAKWRDASTPTRAAMTQATVMQIQAGVLRPDSVVALEQLGYDETDIQRIKAEHDAAPDPITGLGSLLNGQAVSDAASNAPVSTGEPGVAGGGGSGLPAGVADAGSAAA